MIDLEVVSVADPAEDRTKDRLVDVLHALAASADQVMVVLGNARDVRRDVPRSLQPRRHAGLHLRLKGAVDRRESEPRVAAVQTLVQLLRRGGLPLSRKGLRDYDPLFGEAPAP